MDATTAQLLDYYREHLNELVSRGAIPESEAATAGHYADCIATGTDPHGAAVAEAEDITRTA